MIVADPDDLDAIRTLLTTVVDSVEKLEIVVHLHRARSRPQGSPEMTRKLRLSPPRIAEALAALLGAGVIRTSYFEDEAGWSLDLHSSWRSCIELLIELYDFDRDGLLGVMKCVVGQRAVGSSFVRRRVGTTRPN